MAVARLGQARGNSALLMPMAVDAQMDRPEKGNALKSVEKTLLNL